MSRPIKFRAWDKDRGTIVTGIEPTDFVSPELQQQLNKGAIELMQFTGLKDKNGVEIYEGDIVHISEITSVKGMHNADDPYYASIDFSNGGFAFNMIGWEEGDNPETGGDYLHAHISSICEVIGNIYENKELLK